LKKSSEALANGAYRVVENDQNDFFSFIRYTDNETVLVVVSLSGIPERVNIRLDGSRKYKSAGSLLNKEIRKLDNNRFALELPPYEVQVFKLN
jgi:hypothetical protein